MGPLHGGTPGLMDRLVRDTETTINNLVSRRKGLEAELVTLQAEEQEARNVLHFLKTGIEVVPAVREPRAYKTAVSKEDFLAAIDCVSEEKEEFTAEDVSNLVDSNLNAVGSRLSSMAKDNYYIRVTRKSQMKSGGKGGRTPQYYRKLRPPVGKTN